MQFACRMPPAHGHDPGVASEPYLLDVNIRRVGLTVAQGAAGMRLDMLLF